MSSLYYANILFFPFCRIAELYQKRIEIGFDMKEGLAHVALNLCVKPTQEEAITEVVL